MRSLRLSATVLSCLLLLPASITVAADDEAVSFNRDVRTILADKCFACHGPDKNKRKAELRLDDEASAKDAVIVVGKPDESELLRRITTDDADERMPPGSTGKSLTDAQIETLRKWIAQGAKWEEHWSLIRPERPDVPEVAADAGAVNAIDRFVLSALPSKELKSSPLADRRTLLRRLSFDLIGLPPTAKEVQAFEQDESPGAYEKVVDRLLSSKHFGERMAMYWLDVVRYADTGGYHSDNHRDVSPYRDYVINAFNNNLPFNQFTVEQLAGDLIPAATNQQKIASGYNRLLQTTQEGGAQPKEYTAKYLADRVRNTSAAWLGMTMGCAECHNHKFDPFTTNDFYSFGAFFADVQEVAVGNQAQVALPTAEQDEELAELSKNLEALRKELAASTPEYIVARAKWAQEAAIKLSAGKAEWIAIKPAAVTSIGKQTLNVQDDASVLASGGNPATDTYEVALQAEPKPITGIRLEAMTHDSLVKKSLSRANGNFVMTSFEVEVRPKEGDAQPVKIKQALADFAQDGFPIANALDGKPTTGWAVDGHNKVANRQAVFIFAEPVTLPEGAQLLVRMRHDSVHAQHNIGRFRLAVTSAENPGLSDSGGVPEAVAAALKIAADNRDDAQKQAIDNHYRSFAPALANVRKQISDAEAQEAALRKSFPQTLISVSISPRTVRVLPRGNWLDDSGEEVGPATPAVLPATEIKDRQRARLDLANWMASDDNPLTPRVFVNRLWKLYFGRGIVASLDDFGTQGQRPTHPELLDWLAVEFRESGWNVHHMIRLMVMSRTYQQSSYASARDRAKDPNNQWLARQGRFRIDAEMVRDNALSISGLLSDTIGGPSVRPYQPAGYWQHLNFPKRTWQHDKGTGLYRRGLYTYWQRTFLHPSLLAFDAPSREECTVERPRSNTPLQALVLLNDPTYVEAARGFAQRIVQEGGGTEQERLAFSFAIALNRKPSDEESEVLLGLYHKHLEQYKADAEAAEAITSVGELPKVTDLDRADLSAWTSVARVILNLHETITRY